MNKEALLPLPPSAAIVKNWSPRGDTWGWKNAISKTVIAPLAAQK